MLPQLITTGALLIAAFGGGYLLGDGAVERPSRGTVAEPDGTVREGEKYAELTPPMPPPVGGQPAAESSPR